MYSRTIKNTSEEREYPFTLPERYGGSRFRRAKEPTVHVHTETSVPQTPSPIHLSPAAADIVEEEPRLPVIDTIADATADSAKVTDDTAAATATEPSSDSAVEAIGASTGFPLSGLNAEDLLLIGLILLLSAEGEEASELPVLLALLLAYRPSENK